MEVRLMIGAIAGDIIGSVYEWNRIKTKQFELFSPDCYFTDDSVLTIALADSILNDQDYGTTMKSYYRSYPHAGYGGFFHQWARSRESEPYNSYGNGAAMRISPVGFAQAFYGGVPEFITQKVMEILDEDLRKITLKFLELYCKT